MPPDSSEIDAALVAVLRNDQTLMALVPDGVYMDVADPGKTRFVIVALLSEGDVPVFGHRGFEDAVYLVKAVMLESANGDIRQAAHRIDQLLEDQPLTVPGYGWMSTAREERIRFPEMDDANPKIRWLHRGGHYRVQFAVA